MSGVVSVDAVLGVALYILADVLDVGCLLWCCCWSENLVVAWGKGEIATELELV